MIFGKQTKHIKLQNTHLYRFLSIFVVQYPCKGMSFMEKWVIKQHFFDIRDYKFGLERLNNGVSSVL